LKSGLRTQTTILERIKNLKLLLRTETPTWRELEPKIGAKNWNSNLKRILNWRLGLKTATPVSRSQNWG
jgi:hypothetical protein